MLIVMQLLKAANSDDNIVGHRLTTMILTNQPILKKNFTGRFLGKFVVNTRTYARTHARTHTHAHTFNGPLLGSTRVSRYQEGKTNLDFTEARDSEWQWHQLGHMQVCTLLQTDNHASTSLLKFFTGRMTFLPPKQCQSTVVKWILKIPSHSAYVATRPCGFFSSVNIWQSYKQECDCLVHFLRVLAVCWPGMQSAWDNHALACNYAKYSQTLKKISLTGSTINLC